MVVSFSGTRIRSFLACSTDFRIASGTSRALPSPTPTCPRPSPTTTRAVKEKRRPPFTTLATRLMATTRSVRSSALASIFASATQSLPLCQLKSQPAGSGRLGQGLDPPVVLITAAVEHDLADPVGLGLLCHQLAYDLGRGHVALRLGPALEVGGATVYGHQRTPRGVVHHLRVDVIEAAEDSQAGPLRRALHLPAHPQVPDVASHHLEGGPHHLAPAFLPTLRRLCSSAYLMPLPLEGSGLRRARSLAVVWPGSALSEPLRVMDTWRSISACTPSGRGKITGCE